MCHGASDARDLVAAGCGESEQGGFGGDESSRPNGRRGGATPKDESISFFFFLSEKIIVSCAMSF